VKQPTAGIILAAGESLRFGRPKLLASFKGKRLIEWVLDSCLQSKLQHIVLVLGHQHRALRRALGHRIQHPRLTIAVNSRYREGQSTSLCAGLREVEHEFNSVMFVLGDQPIVTPGLIDMLLEKFWESARQICVPVCKGRRGNPVLFSRSFYKPISALQGDVGAREIIKANPKEVLKVEIGSPLVFFDVDTEADLQTLESRLSGARAHENLPDL
jgi:molybdenum cofactor cytidylyltransferase